MAYGVKSKYKRKYARKGRVAKLAKGKTTSVQALAKAVKAIQSKMKRKTVILNYGQKFDKDLSSDYDQFNLSNYSAYSRIFGSSSDDESCKKAIHRGFGIDMYFNSSTETDPINFTVFLVSLKDNMRASAWNHSTGSLSLSSDVDYYYQQGFTLLNKNNFNIHSVKRFTLSNNGQGFGTSTAQVQYGTERRVYMKMRCNKQIENINGNWKALDCSQDPSDNYYLLVFNDNGIADATYPRIRAAVVHTIEQLA